jgi:hypothetical protein
MPKLFFLERGFLVELCKETRFMVIHLRKYIIEATVLTVYAKEKLCLFHEYN